MIRKKLGATPDVLCYICPDQINQFQHDLLLQCCTNFIIGVEIRMPPSYVKLLVGRGDCVEPGMVRDVCMAEIACRFAATNISVVVVQEPTSVFVEIIEE